MEIKKNRIHKHVNLLHRTKYNDMEDEMKGQEVRQSEGVGSAPAPAKEKSKRDLLRERLSKKYPDKNFDDDEEFAGQIGADYDDYDNRIADFEKNERAIGDMFSADPRAASFLMDWKDGSDPVVALVNVLGKDAIEAANDPERQEEIAKANKEYLERIKKSKELNKEYESNLQESLQTLQDVQEEKGWSDEQVDGAFQTLFKIVDDAILGKFSPDVLQLVMNAQNYDHDVAMAQQEGEVKGRNSKIEEKLRKAKSGDGMPQLNGKSHKVAQPKTSQQSIFSLASQA